MNRKQAKLLRVAAAIPEVTVGNVSYNVSKIIELLDKSEEQGVDIIVFPELCVTGYSCGDLFFQECLIEAAEQGVADICEHTKNHKQVIIIGAPARADGNEPIFNTALVIYKGEVVKAVGKRNLPGYKEFYEPRWFSRDNFPFRVFESEDGVKFGVEICEDVWAPFPPCTTMVQAGAEVIFNLSTSNELIGKHQYLVSMLRQRSADHICGYVYASSGFGESTQDLVYQGNALIFENGKLLAQNNRSLVTNTGGQIAVNDIDLESLRNERAVNTTFRQFRADYNPRDVTKWQIPGSIIGDGDTVRKWNPKPFVPIGKELDDRCKDILTMQSAALAKRLYHTRMKPVIGISGGSDSTWALIVAIEAMKMLGNPVSDIIGVTMPGFATSERTKKNSWALMKAFGIDAREISIVDMATAELKALGHDLTTQDVTYENVQARSRTQILMNLSNQEKGLVIGTGDLSELALGWCTYNADHMSMYGVNASVPKTLIKKLIGWYASWVMVSNRELHDTLMDILDTPVSPELTGSGAGGQDAQVTEDKIGPYELHDFFLYNMLRHGYGPAKIMYLAEHTREGWSKDYTRADLKQWLQVFINRFFSQQFKRSCLPDGPKIGSISLSPRGDWRMPSDANQYEWFKQLKEYGD